MALTRAKHELSKALGIQTRALQVERDEAELRRDKIERDKLGLRITSNLDTDEIITRGIDKIVQELGLRGLTEPEESILFIPHQVVQEPEQTKGRVFKKTIPARDELEGSLVQITINPEERVLILNNTSITLSRNELKILQSLIDRQNSPMKPRDLARSLYGHEPSQAEVQSLYRAISTLKSKTRQTSEDPAIIINTNKGYELLTVPEIVREERKAKTDSKTRSNETYILSDAAEMSRLPTSSVKNYARTGILEPTKHFIPSERGDRTYLEITEAGVERLKLIRTITGGKRLRSETLLKRLSNALAERKERKKAKTRYEKVSWKLVKPFTFQEEAKLSHRLIERATALRTKYEVTFSHLGLSEAEQAWKNFNTLKLQNPDRDQLEDKLKEKLVPVDQLCERVKAKLLQLSTDPEKSLEKKFGNRSRSDYYNPVVAEVLQALRTLPIAQRREFIESLMEPGIRYEVSNIDGLTSRAG